MADIARGTFYYAARRLNLAWRELFFEMAKTVYPKIDDAILVRIYRERGELEDWADQLNKEPKA